MSLNRSEQLLSDYVDRNPEEKSYWIDKVQAFARTHEDPHLAAGFLAEELWRYFEERSAVAAPFKELALREGLRRTSMRNLAELWLRLWVAPRSKAKKAQQNFSDYF